MNIEDYPAQEPFTEIGQLYHQEVMARAQHLTGIDIAYGADPYQAILVFPADKPNGSVLCAMHGGGWTNGYKEWMAFMAPAMTSQGVTFVSIGYRLAPDHVFPAGYDDCCDGIACVYEKISTYGGDPEHIYLGGHSAGGHYAALMALRQDWQATRQLPQEIIKGALPISATFLFGAESGLSIRPRFLGDEAMAAEKTASPMNYAHNASPPFLIAYGDADFPHLIKQADDFAHSLASLNVKVETLRLEGCNHLGASYASGETGGLWAQQAAQFMQDQAG